MSVVDDYLANVENPQHDMLQHIRKIITHEVPDAQEVITYGMPGFKYKGKYLISFAAFKNHMSLFPGGDAIGDTEAKLKPFRTSKGTLQFTIDKPISDDLLAEIVGFCVARIENGNK